MSRRRPSRWHGLLPVFKRSGPTSHDVVDMARKALKERRIGHTGTLDPQAEGLLLLCIGRVTRLQQFLLGWSKSYCGKIQLGHATTTYDSVGEVIDPQGPAPSLGAEELSELAARFTGEIDQVPPPYSAKKVGGKKLYEMARNGQEVLVAPKLVTVHSLELETAGEGTLGFEVSCSTGFYVRSLAHDMGKELGCGAFLQHLKRSSIGPYNLENAVPQEALTDAVAPDDIINHPAWIAADEIQLPCPEIELNPGAADRFIHGQEVMILRPDPQPLEIGAQVVAKTIDKKLLGLGVVRHVLAHGRTVHIRPSMVLTET